jgi:hypothetical protein
MTGYIKNNSGPDRAVKSGRYVFYSWPLQVITNSGRPAIFTRSFMGKNFFRGIVFNIGLPFGKDAACELRKGEIYNW